MCRWVGKLRRALIVSRVLPCAAWQSKERLRGILGERTVSFRMHRVPLMRMRIAVFRGVRG